MSSKWGGGRDPAKSHNISWWDSRGGKGGRVGGKSTVKEVGRREKSSRCY